MELGIYKHTKTGNLYKVIGVAKHSETLEEFIVYEALYSNSESQLWIRPKIMFLENITINGEELPRFRFLSSESKK